MTGAKGYKGRFASKNSEGKRYSPCRESNEGHTAQVAALLGSPCRRNSEPIIGLGLLLATKAPAPSPQIIVVDPSFPFPGWLVRENAQVSDIIWRPRSLFRTGSHGNYRECFEEHAQRSFTKCSMQIAQGLPRRSLPAVMYNHDLDPLTWAERLSLLCQAYPFKTEMKSILKCKTDWQCCT